MIRKTIAIAGRGIVVPCCFLLAAAPTVSRADDTEAPFKFTWGNYRYQDDVGNDLNLRYQHDGAHWWLGAYRDHSVDTQARAGWDASYAVVDWLSLQPSLQVATGGFVGGSLNAQLGNTWYGVVGLGRTNLKPYANLNFDPNDAVTLGAGHQGDDGSNLSVTWIADNRLHTGQKDLHFTGRWPIGADRLTIDVLHKQGMGDAGPVKAWGGTLTWDFPLWFVRIAYDPNQNFTVIDAWRLSTGVRF